LFLQQSLRELGKIACPEQVVSNLNDCLSEVTKSIGVLGQFLQYSRRPQEKHSNIKLQEVAERIVTLLSESARRVKVELILEPMTHLPGIEGNSGELEQVFFILIQNAIQAGEGHHGGAVHLRGAVVVDGMVELEFSDSCGGIGPEYMDRVFQPFFTTKPPGIGTGLGLCILQQIVTKHGGKVRVDNRVGAGVSFYVRLPISY
jgi:two-component system, NtrC family, sensor kinase